MAAFNLAAIALVLGAAELGVRLMSGADRTDQDDQLPMCRADPLTVWRYKPDVRLTYRAPEFEMQVRTNEEGLRSAATSAEPGPAHGPVHRGLLHLRLGRQRGRAIHRRDRQTLGGVRTVNAGHWMYTFDQQLLLMRQLIERHRPAVVVQGFYWMHVRSLFNHQLERNADGTLRAVLDPKIHVDPRGVLKFRSDWLERPPLGSQLVALVARAVLNRDLRERAADWVDYMRPGSTRDAALWAETDALIGETARLLRGAGIAYVPFLIPASVEVGGTQWSHVGWMGSTPPPGIDVTLPATRFAAMLRRHGAEPVELAAALREQGGAALYFPQDGHWNAAGHAAVGRLLAPAVRRALSRAGNEVFPPGLTHRPHPEERPQAASRRMGNKRGARAHASRRPFGPPQHEAGATSIRSGTP